MTTTPTRFALFGATSAIGLAVARQFAARGAHLFLAARDAAALDRVAADLKTRGAASVETVALDLSLTPELPALVERMGRADRVLIAFGTLPDQRRDERDPAASQQHLVTNFVAPALLLDLLAARAEPGDCLATITSVAGDRGRQSNYLYGAAKGGLSRFLEGLRHRLSPRVRVIDIRPGFVKSPMTDGMDRDGPLWAEPEAVGRSIAKAMNGRHNGTLYVPGIWRVIMTVVRNVPAPIFHKSRL
jgi:decaprenylphospho-beta-D-erythro-pentofuranosid-2-ulose 2-reductase